MSSRRNSRCAPNPRRTDRGSAIITVLILAAVTAVIAAGFLFRSAQEARLATRSFYQAAALNLAEAGIEEGLFAANTSAFTSANGWSLASGSTTDYVKSLTTGFDFQQATGAIYVRVDNAATATPTVTATGVVTIPSQPKILKQIRIGAGPRSVFGNSMVAQSSITFSGSAAVDSYDSNLGAYNVTTNRSDRAAVATGDTVTLSGTASIYGYAATSGTTPNVGVGGRIYGATSPANPLVDPTRIRKDFNANVSDPSAPTGAAISLGNYAITGTTAVSLPRTGDTPASNGRYRYTCSALSLDTTSSLAITGPVDIIVTGNLTVSGAAQLAVGGTGSINPSLNVYCPGTISLGGSGVVNQTGIPAKTTIWGTKQSDPKQTITVSGSSAFVGTLYAPHGNLTLSGTGGIYGAVVADTITLSGTSQFHYDVQLAGFSPTGGPDGDNNNNVTSFSLPLKITAWAELTATPGSGTAFARDNRAPFNTLF